jgi:hypothetical protein
MRSIPSPTLLGDAVSRVTSTMLGLKISSAVAEKGPPRLRWRTAILSIPGQHPLTVALSSDQSGCSVLGSTMFSCRPEELEASMIDDSLCELLNMAAGQIRTLMELDQALGLPRVAEPAAMRLEEDAVCQVVLRSGPVELLLSLIKRAY